MSSLPTTLRRQLESAIKQARKIAEGGARKALEAIAVHEPDPYRHMDESQRDLRRKLRAQAKQLGDGESQTRRGAYEIKHLVEKLAYDQWHRLLFARFLLENNLLISPEHEVSVTLDDCEELAPSLGLKDAGPWRPASPRRNCPRSSAPMIRRARWNGPLRTATRSSTRHRLASGGVHRQRQPRMVLSILAGRAKGRGQCCRQQDRRGRTAGGHAVVHRRLHGGLPAR